jgi:cytoskeletal protein CcmA (bactofilin family)
MSALRILNIMIIVESTSRISNGSSFQGDLSTTGKLIVAGSVDGNLKVQGILQLTASGSCKGSIEAPIVIIYGKIVGNIYAEHRIELHEDAVVCGNIVTSALKIHSGARVTGYISRERRLKLTLVENDKTSQTSSNVKPFIDRRAARHG